MSRWDYSSPIAMVQDETSRPQSRNRRQILKAAGTTVALSPFAGCLGNGDSGGVGDSVKIGLLLPLSGAFSITGQETKRGAEMAKEHLGGSIEGAKIEFVERDSQGNASTGLEGARALVEKENVDAIIGPAISSVGLSVIPYIRDRAQVPTMLTAVSNANAREGENCTEYTFFIWPSNHHFVPVGVDFIYDMPDLVDRQFDPNKIHFFAPDYALGQNNLKLLKKEMKSRGGTVVGSTLAPIGTQDLSSYISELSNSSADVVTGVLTPGMAVRLINQASEFGLHEQKVMMFNSGKPVDQITLSSVGGAANGWYGTYFYNPASDSEINQAFKDLYPSDADLLPNGSCGTGFEQMRALAKGIQQAGSTDADAVIDQLNGLSWESILGSVKYRDGDGQLEVDFVGATREKENYKVLKEYPNRIPEQRC